MRMNRIICLICLLLCSAASAETNWFERSLAAYRAGDYAEASRGFRELALRSPSAGVLHNLGNAEWQRGRTGPAIVAWEQALWLDPRHEPSRNNLRYARRISQLESPQLAWHEVISTWLPADWWAWITGVSFWAAVSAASLPGFLRWRRSAFHHGIAALGFMIFLLSLPAQFGVHSRSQIGFVLDRDTLLRLTPTSEAQTITRLGAGEPLRVLRTRGHYVLIQISRGTGWLERGEIGRVASSAVKPSRF